MLVDVALELIGQVLFKLIACEATGRIAERAAGAARELAPVWQGERAADSPVLSLIPPVQIVSHTPGRLRMEVAGLQDEAELAAKINKALSSQAGVYEAGASPRSGRVLVRFDTGRAEVQGLIRAVDRVRSRQLGRRARPAARLVAVS